MIYITLGHIDHGKSALAHILTGHDTDKSPEEKKRGITIEPSFLPFGEGTIIDVPGHLSLIDNMVAVASGIDVAILVVAANDGVMPQTKEHLQVLNILGAKSGIIVINKCDIADLSQIENVNAEIKKLCKDTFLQAAPVFLVSCKTGEGINKVKNHLLTLRQQQNQLADKPVFLPIDRAFVKKGIGTVVTGTLQSGCICEKDEIFIYPEGQKAVARTLQVRGEKKQKVVATERVAINLAGLSTIKIKKGKVLAAYKSVNVTAAFGARLVQNSTKGKGQAQIIVGTASALCTVSIKEDFAHIKTETPIPLVNGQKFILRQLSPSLVLGGGEIICTNLLNTKKFDRHTFLQLKDAECGITQKPNNIKPQIQNIEILYQIINESKLEPPFVRDIAKQIGISEEICRHMVQKLCEEKKALKIRDNLYIAFEQFNVFYEAMCDVIKAQGYADIQNIKTRFNISRKFASALLEFCDNNNITLNSDNKRTKGEKDAQNLRG